jgi:hypothetical protein
MQLLLCCMNFLLWKYMIHSQFYMRKWTNPADLLGKAKNISYPSSGALIGRFPSSDYPYLGDHESDIGEFLKFAFG